MMIPIEIVAIVLTAFLGFVGFIAYQVYVIKTNDLHHLELNLKRLMDHFKIDWED